MTELADTLGLVGDELERWVRRLRTLSPRALAMRREAAMTALAAMADLDADAAGLNRRTVPDLPDHALADAAAVIGGDALESLSEKPDSDIADRLLGVVRAALDQTR